MLRKLLWSQQRAVANNCFTVTFLKHSFSTTTMSQSGNPESYIIKVDDAKKFVKESMVAVGTKDSHAQALAELLVLADQRGHYSHGVNRLGE